MKVITAMGDEFLNNKLRKLKKYEIIGKDISYKEGILEILEINKQINLIILSNKISGEIKFEFLIEEIIKNKNIEIIVFLKEKNDYLENFLNSKKIIKIYFLDNNGYNLFFENFENKLENEIKDLKNLIISNRKYRKKLKLIRLKKIRLNGKINLKKTHKKDFYNKNNNCRTVVIAGSGGCGKTIISKILFDYIKRKNKKVFLLNLENNNQNKYYINNYYNIKKYMENLKEKYDYLIIDLELNFKEIKIILYSGDKIIFLIEPNLSEIKKAKNILDIYINDFEINVDKIKILFNKTNKYKIAKNLLEEIFDEFKIIGEIKYDEKYNLIINKNKIENYSENEYEKIYKVI